MEVSEDFINNVLLKDVPTKWLMSNFRHRKNMRLFADGYLFGIVDVVYQNGELNETRKSTKICRMMWNN